MYDINRVRRPTNPKRYSTFAILPPSTQTRMKLHALEPKALGLTLRPTNWRMMVLQAAQSSVAARTEIPFIFKGRLSFPSAPPRTFPDIVILLAPAPPRASRLCSRACSTLGAATLRRGLNGWE